jgi:hypothetical protein
VLCAGTLPQMVKIDVGRSRLRSKIPPLHRAPLRAQKMEPTAARHELAPRAAG